MEGYASDHGHGEEKESPERAMILRIKEKPLECGPEDVKPSRISPGAKDDSLGRRRERGMAPTANPQRS